VDNSNLFVGRVDYFYIKYSEASSSTFFDFSAKESIGNRKWVVSILTDE
jgi:hypothetical protein